MENKTFGWQFQFVSQLGPDAYSVEGVAENSPLIVQQDNLPIGASISNQEILGPYLLIRYGLPEDIPGVFEWDGRVRILKKSLEFARDPDDDSAVTVFSPIFNTGLDRGYADTWTVIDHAIGNPGDIWYYSIFYGDALSGKWAISQEHCLRRNWTYDNAESSPLGDMLYAYLPSEVRYLDATEADLAQYRFMQVLGRVLDRVHEEIKHTNQKAYDVSRVDASFLPYIDGLIGWPTNFELSEIHRRRETLEAVGIWKSKGSIPALEFAIQVLTGWTATIKEGERWTLKTYDGSTRLDPNSPPPDWTAEDGDWQSLTSGLPYQLTYSPDQIRSQATVDAFDPISVTHSTERKSELGVGFNWKNPHGVLIELTPVPDRQVSLQDVVVQKIRRMLPFMLPHYLSAILRLLIRSEESYDPFDEDSHFDTLISTEPFDGLSDEIAKDTGNKLLAHTWPHPGYRWDSLTNSEFAVSYHSWLHFDGEPEPFYEVFGSTLRNKASEL